VRNVGPIKINEFCISAGSPANSTDSFIELYNAGAGSVDISNWTLTQQPVFSSVKIPPGTKLAARGFYLLGLSNSGLAVPARAGDTTINVRSTTGMKVGDTIGIDTASNVEIRKIASIGTAAGNSTTLWQPLPDGPVITNPAGSTSVPVTSVTGLAAGEKIGIGYGATFPTVAKALERYEVVTVTAVGKPGTQAFLGADAPAGATNIKVTSVANISAGDKIRLDIDSVGHGIETVTITKVGTQASRSAPASRSTAPWSRPTRSAEVWCPELAVTQSIGHLLFVIGYLSFSFRLLLGAAAVIATVGTAGATTAGGATITVAAPLTFAHAAGAQVSGTGITLSAALTRAHAGGAPVAGSVPTPGAANEYYRKGLSAKK